MGIYLFGRIAYLVVTDLENEKMNWVINKVKVKMGTDAVPDAAALARAVDVRDRTDAKCPSF